MEELRGKENTLEIKKVEYQKLTSEDEVVKKAKEKFDFVRIDNLDKININKNKIENLKKLVAKKYDLFPSSPYNLFCVCSVYWLSCSIVLRANRRA